MKGSTAKPYAMKLIDKQTHRRDLGSVGRYLLRTHTYMNVYLHVCMYMCV